MKWLINLKSIVSRQLPKMPKEYIARLTLDREHESMVILKKLPASEEKQVIGGCVFRPFYGQNLAEIVFLAIDSQHQVKGFGTRLMNKLKSSLREREVLFFLTYADNMATEYFQKQGFSGSLRLPKSRYRRFIKDYENGTLMECYLDPTVDFNGISSVLRHQREQVINLLFRATPFAETPYTLDNSVPVKFDTIEGLPEAGYSKQFYMSQRLAERRRPFREKAQKVMDQLRKKDAIWPFVERVNEEVAPDYYQLIKTPMWLEKVAHKLELGEYEDSLERFSEDLNRIFDNAISYNRPDTVYHKYAVQLKHFLKGLIADLDSEMKKLRLQESTKTNSSLLTQ